MTERSCDPKLSGASHVGLVLCHTLVQCECLFGPSQKLMDLTIYNGDVHESVAKNILRLLSNYFAIILSCPVTSIKPDFHMSGKSQTIRVFTVSRLSQILPTNENVDIPNLGWTGTNLENRERFYFPDAFQICVACEQQTHFRYDRKCVCCSQAKICVMVGNHFRQMKTQICFVGDVGDGFLSQCFCHLLHFPD